MINIIQGGHFAKKGYWYRIYMTFPSFNNRTTVAINGSEHKSTKISLPTKFMLTRNSIYTNIDIRVLGFGLGLEIQSKG